MDSSEPAVELELDLSNCASRETKLYAHTRRPKLTVTTDLNFLNEVAPEYIDDLVRKGQATSAFQIMFQHLQEYNDFEEGTTEEEISDLKLYVFDKFKRHLAESIKKNTVCCDQPVDVMAAYDFENEEHSIAILCTSCRSYKQIKAAPATTNSENGQALHLKPSYHTNRLEVTHA
jgi:hypothetical protein